MIRIVLLDIDGVLTDGRVTLDALGNESKTIHFRDLDAVAELRRRGFKVGFVTGEATPIVKVFEARFKADHFYSGCKDKPKALQAVLEAEAATADEVCYVGDGKYDIPVMRLVGFAACPADAIAEVKALATTVLSSKGGEGCVWELLGLLEPPAEKQ